MGGQAIKIYFKIETIIKDALFITMCDNRRPIMYLPSLFYVFISLLPVLNTQVNML
jgi:hypothetical protein